MSVVVDLETVKELDFYKAKVNELRTSVRSLEYDNAELVSKNNVLVDKLKRVTGKPRNAKPRYQKDRR